MYRPQDKLVHHRFRWDEFRCETEKTSIVRALHSPIANSFDIRVKISCSLVPTLSSF